MYPRASRARPDPNPKKHSPILEARRRPTFRVTEPAKYEKGAQKGVRMDGQGRAVFEIGKRARNREGDRGDGTLPTVLLYHPACGHSI